jgi:hypothetical protein
LFKFYFVTFNNIITLFENINGIDILIFKKKKKNLI